MSTHPRACLELLLVPVVVVRVSSCVIDLPDTRPVHRHVLAVMLEIVDNLDEGHCVVGSDVEESCSGSRLGRPHAAACDGSPLGRRGGRAMEQREALHHRRSGRWASRSPLLRSRGNDRTTSSCCWPIGEPPRFGRASSCGGVSPRHPSVKQCHPTGRADRRYGWLCGLRQSPRNLRVVQTSHLGARSRATHERRSPGG